MAEGAIEREQWSWGESDLARWLWEKDTQNGEDFWRKKINFKRGWGSVPPRTASHSVQRINLFPLTYPNLFI